MTYDYQAEREKLFTEAGQRQFLAVRDKARRLLAQAGAVMSGNIMVAGDSWVSLAAMDRMIELGELVEVTTKGVAGQHRVFVRGAALDREAPR